MSNKPWSKEQRKWVVKSGRFDIITPPDYILPDRVNKLIDDGVVKYYSSIDKFRKRIQ